MKNLLVSLIFAFNSVVPRTAQAESAFERVPIMSSLRLGQSIVRSKNDYQFYFELCDVNFSEALMTNKKLLDVLQVAPCKVISPAFLVGDSRDITDINARFSQDFKAQFEVRNWTAGSIALAGTAFGASTAALYGYFVATDVSSNFVNRLGFAFGLVSTIFMGVMDYLILQKPAITIELELKDVEHQLPQGASETIFEAVVNAIRSSTDYVFTKNHSA
jgi:hypothetical protein